MATLDVPGGQIHYEVHGGGYPVLLFAPGFLSSRIERWSTNPARRGVAQDWLDPVPALEQDFQLIALDVRNAGSSRVTLRPDDDWSSYTADHLALLDHLGVKQCHIMGACIGVSFAFGVVQARPGMATALVLQNPIGLSSTNRAALDGEFDSWAREASAWPNIDKSLLEGFRKRMFGGDFIFSVTAAYARACELPMFLMPGNDVVHPAEVSAELARAPKVEVMDPWKGPSYRDEAMRRVHDFLIAHRPPAPRA